MNDKLKKFFDTYHLIVRCLGIMNRVSSIMLITSIVLATVTSILPSVELFYRGMFFTSLVDVFRTSKYDGSVKYLLFMILVWFINLVIIDVNYYIKLKLSTDCELVMQKDVIRKVNKLRIEEFYKPDTYDLITRTSNIGSTVYNTVFSLFSWFTSLIRILSLGVLLSKIYLPLSFLIILSTIPFIIMRYIHSIEEYQQNINQTKENRMTNYLYRIITTREFAKEIKFFNLYEYIKNKWVSICLDLFNRKHELQKKHLRLELATHILRVISLLGCLTIVIWRILIGKAQIGGLAISISTLDDIQWILLSLVSVYTGLSINLLVFRDYDSLMNLAEEIPVINKDDHNILTNDIPLIRFENVSYRYPGSEKNAISNISLTIKPFESVVLVGPNGSGKSTFVALMMGLLKPTSGTIYFDDIPIDECLPSIRKKVSCVFQDFLKYQATISENILLGDISSNTDNKEHVRKRIISAAEEAGIDSYISTLPLRYDTHLGQLEEGGTDLSGGQWQKIAIARALFNEEAKISIFDEPTASLDPLSEAAIYENILLNKGKKTLILVSHRLGATVLSDIVYVFYQGCIVEKGPHDILLAANGLYSTLYNEQSKWYA